MAITYYEAVEGEVLGERTGNERLDYLADALGSVVASVDQSLVLKHSARFKPYGSLLSLDGTAPDFLWLGAFGYRRSNFLGADYYVRARHYSAIEGRWRSVDPLWPSLPSYTYARSNPNRWADPSGLIPIYVAINAFINKHTFGSRVNVGSVGRGWSDPGVLSSSTDRYPYDHTKTNRGQTSISIDSEGIGFGAPSHRTWIGVTTVYAVERKVVDDRGHQYEVFSRSGYNRCRNSWLRLHVRYCAALLPNSEEACIDHRFTIVFEIVKKNLISITLKNIEIDAFPDMDAWVTARSYMSWFHEPANIGKGKLHPFAGLAYRRLVSDRTMKVNAPTPAGCGNSGDRTAFRSCASAVT